MDSASVVNRVKFSDRQVNSLETKKIFFGHQSVGADIIHGIQDLMAEDPRLKLNIVSSADPESVPGPAFVESPIGENRKPQSKNEAFALTFTDSDSFLESGIIDSSGVLQLVSYLEETYGITVEDDGLTPDNFDSVNFVAAYLSRKLNGSGEAVLRNITGPTARTA